MAPVSRSRVGARPRTAQISPSRGGTEKLRMHHGHRLELWPISMGIRMGAGALASCQPASTAIARTGTASHGIRRSATPAGPHQALTCPQRQAADHQGIGQLDPEHAFAGGHSHVGPEAQGPGGQHRRSRGSGGDADEQPVDHRQPRGRPQVRGEPFDQVLAHVPFPPPRRRAASF